MKVARRLGTAKYRSTVKFVTIFVFLGFVYLYASNNMHSGVVDAGGGAKINSLTVSRRHLLLFSDGDDESGGDDGNDDDGDGDDDNCTLPRSHKNYNDSCSFVLDNCGDQYQLFNYLKFVLCDLSAVQVTSTDI